MERNKLVSKKSKGFTLMELLIVFAIVGILTAIVVVALNDARSKGADGGVKSNLNSARSQAEVYYNVNTDNPNTYTGVCINGTVGGGVEGIGLAIHSAAKAAGLGNASNNYSINEVPDAPALDIATCNTSSGAWVVEVPLPGSEGMWCVDNTGASQRNVSSIGTGGTSCN